MSVSKLVLCACLLCVGIAVKPSFAQGVVPAAGTDSKVLLDMSEGVEKRVAPSSAQVSVKRAPTGLEVAVAPGEEGYPGLSIKPEGGAWNLSKYGHVEARFTNTGTKEITLSLRVDNAGDWRDNPWNTESVTIKPGESKSVKTVFGYAYGLKPSFALKPEAVVNVLVFALKSDVAQSFRIESVVATGPAGEKPPVAPDSIRQKPLNGFLLGGGVTVDAATQLTATSAQNSLDEKGRWNIAFSAPDGKGTATLKPALGRWDLRDFLEVRVKVKNAGVSALTPRVRLESNGGSSKWQELAPLAPGGEGEIVVPFNNGNTIDLDQKETGDRVASNTVSGVMVSANGGTGKQMLSVESVRAVLPPAPALPDWLGKRPPVAGEWTQTLNEDFDGAAVDESKWNIYTENYWDKVSHFSKDNTLIGGGMATLRMEKKRGFDWDTPTRKETDYAVGYLDSYGKWTQRYGYFEARMKLPSAPGLWPAFWMMPDRGQGVGAEQWRRADTKNGGMEFDIMEHLTGWGPHRYNIAQHWDGYDKEHQSKGTDKAYLQPDNDGFITCGLLWLPGEVVYYGNGKEILRWKNERISNVPCNLILYMVTGGWENLPVDDATLPADFTIDYVRAWQRKDLASPVDNNGGK
ncbi:glycoside hydrolase family 16 protein [bacterium]|nr:MAG: glycoside hydrolase family 16 protein [bacterium]